MIHALKEERQRAFWPAWPKCLIANEIPMKIILALGRKAMLGLGIMNAIHILASLGYASQLISPSVNHKTKRTVMHKSITLDRIMKAVERQSCSLDNPGFCIACGEEKDDCEPEARNYECESCGKHKVFGAEELLMMVA